MPRVSVIIPAFNAEAHIAETLASVERQGFRDWELILADDGSTDRTREIAGRFTGPLRLLPAGRREGPAAARNRAIEASSGELLAFLDADDLWLPDYLERQVRLYDGERGRGAPVGIVACDARVLGADGYLEQTYLELMGFPRELTLTHLLSANSIYVGALAPRAVVDEAGGFCPEIVGSEDYDLWLRIVELGYRAVATREPLAVYRLGTASVSSDPGRMARAVQLTYRRALDRGNLTGPQRRIARRRLRLQRAIEQAGSLRAARHGGRRPYARLARALPLLALVAAENPIRVLRILAGRGSPLSQVGR